MSQWTEWSGCSETCDKGFVRSRTRRCDNPVPQFGGLCKGDREEHQSCNSNIDKGSMCFKHNHRFCQHMSINLLCLFSLAHCCVWCFGGLWSKQSFQRMQVGRHDNLKIRTRWSRRNCLWRMVQNTAHLWDISRGTMETIPQYDPRERQHQHVEDTKR